MHQDPEEIEVIGEAATEEAGPDPDPKEAARIKIRIEAPDTRICPPVTPAGSTGFMGRGRGFVLTATAAPGGTLRTRGRDTTETSWPALK